MCPAAHESRRCRRVACRPSRESLADNSDELPEESEKLTADTQQLTAEIAAFSAEIADLDAMMAKATSLREPEKGKNTANIEDAKGAHAAMQQAVTVLKESYATLAQVIIVMLVPVFTHEYEETHSEHVDIDMSKVRHGGMASVVISVVR